MCSRGFDCQKIVLTRQKNQQRCRGRRIVNNKAVHQKNKLRHHSISFLCFFLPQDTNRDISRNAVLFSTMKVNGDHSCPTRFSRQDNKQREVTIWVCCAQKIMNIWNKNKLSKIDRSWSPFTFITDKSARNVYGRQKERDTFFNKSTCGWVTWQNLDLKTQTTSFLCIFYKVQLDKTHLIYSRVTRKGQLYEKTGKKNSSLQNISQHLLQTKKKNFQKENWRYCC